jgi:hypothetical protein
VEEVTLTSPLFLASGVVGKKRVRRHQRERSTMHEQEVGEGEDRKQQRFFYILVECPCVATVS